MTGEVGSHNNRSIINIEGELVALGPVTRAVYEHDWRWINQFEMVRNLAMDPAPLTLDTEAYWFEVRAKDRSNATFIIYERDTWQPLGLTNITRIDYRNGTANFGISISEQSARGKGYGTETTRLSVDYAFTALGLRNVMLAVYEFNLGAHARL